MLTQEQFNNERDYCTLIPPIKAMLQRGVIDAKDFALLQRKLLEQYRPVVSGLRAGSCHIPQDAPADQAKISPPARAEKTCILPPPE